MDKALEDQAAMYELFEAKKKQHDLKMKLNKMYLKYGDYE